MKILHKLLFPLLASSLLCWSGVLSYTLLDSDVSGHLVLTKYSSPYLVSNGLVVPEGSTLQIEPGVEMMFELGSGLDVYGDLLAYGIASQRIVFRLSDEPPTNSGPETNRTEPGVQLIQKTRPDRGELCL